MYLRRQDELFEKNRKPGDTEKVPRPVFIFDIDCFRY